MAGLPIHTLSPSEAIALSGSRVELAHWINLSWFLPATFRSKRVVETHNSLLVIGTEEVYKFRLASSQLGFKDQWREACEEVKDHEQLSPGLYCGIRCLRWIDDEPHWTTEAAIPDPDPYFVPSDADEAVLIYRAISQSQLLPATLSSGNQFPETYLKRIATHLCNFHSQQSEGAAIRFINDGDEFLSKRKQYWRGLLTAAAERRSIVRSPLCAAIDELSAFINRFIGENMSRLEARGEEGKIVNCHGNLLSHNIAFPDDSRVWLLDRVPRLSQMRRQDSLSEICGLIGDLYLRGHTQAAIYFEEQYSKLSGESPDDPLFAFFVATTSLRHTTKYLIQAEHRLDKQETIETAEAIISTAYRYHLGLKRPVVIGIAGAHTPEKSALTDDIARLANATVVHSEDEISPNRVGSRAPAEEAIERGVTLVVDKTFYRRTDRIELARLAERHDAPYLLVQCALSREEELTRRPETTVEKLPTLEVLSEKSRSWDSQILGKDSSIIYIDPVIPSDLLATQVLRAVAPGAKR